MNRSDRIWLLVLAVVFLAWHVPLEFRTAAGQDEDWYAVAGSMVLRGGLPRVPYSPSRDPTAAAYKIDVALYALPPLNSYLQAVIHLVLGDGVGPARLTSTLMGLVAVYLVYGLARIWFEDRRVAVFSATAFITSRAFLFPATMARPDMAAATFGLLALWFVVRHRRAPFDQLLVLGGAAAGLSLLCHPFGLVPVAQSGVALLAERVSLPRRLRGALIFSGVALAFFALWLPLIALHPALFRAQFSANVLGRAGPGLGKTLLSPQAILLFQARQFQDFVQPLQSGLYVLALVWNLPRAKSTPGGREFLAHCAGSALLLAILEGRHPTLGYYVYPVALMSIAVGRLAGDLATLLERGAAPRRGSPRAVATSLAVGLLLLAFLPGAGLRTLWAHARHLRDPSYNAHFLSRRIMADIPDSALIAVDGAYVLDFYLARRRVVEVTIHPLNFDVRDHPFEYAVLGPSALRLYKACLTDLVFVRAYGDKDDPFAPYAELYRRVLPRLDK